MTARTNESNDNPDGLTLEERAARFAEERRVKGRTKMVEQREKARTAGVDIGSLEDRPPEFLQSHMNTFLEALRVGTRFSLACSLAGLSVARARAWLQKGRLLAEGFHKTFFDEYTKASSQGELRLVSEIVKAGREAKHWKANAYLLEAKKPRAYRRPGTNIAIVNPGSGDLDPNLIPIADSIQKDRLLGLLNAHRHRPPENVVKDGEEVVDHLGEAGEQAN